MGTVVRLSDNERILRLQDSVAALGDHVEALQRELMDIRNEAYRQQQMDNIIVEGLVRLEDKLELLHHQAEGAALKSEGV